MADASGRIVRASLKTAQFREGSSARTYNMYHNTHPPERRQVAGIRLPRVITCASDFCNNNATEHDDALRSPPLWRFSRSPLSQPPPSGPGHGYGHRAPPKLGSRGNKIKRGWAGARRRNGTAVPHSTPHSARTTPSMHPPRFPPGQNSDSPGRRGARQRRAGVWVWWCPPPAWPGSPPGPPAASCCSWVRAPAPRTSRGTARPRSPPRRSAPSSREPLPSRVQSAPLAPAGPTAARARRGQSFDSTAADNLGWPR